MPLTPGRRFGAYEIIAAIGAGGMGEVYRARDSRLGRDVALKVLPGAIADDPERRLRFEREAKLLGSLNHPNIAAIHGYEEADGVQGIVLELVEGPTLADRIAQGPIPLAEALAIAAQIADALETAHNSGIVHRDLKPANIKVRSDGTVKVLDFGLAKALEPEHPSVLSESATITHHATRAGVILGTVAYMSPEQARGIAVDKRADVWAFGCLLYEMLTGTRAFGGNDATDTIVSVMTHEPTWDLLPPQTPTAVQRVLRRCVVKDPRARLRDLGDAQIDLREALASPADGAAAAVTPGRKARVVPWLIAIVIGMLASGLAGWSVARRVETPRSPIQRLMVGLPATAPLASSSVESLAISPKGDVLVYVGPGTGPRTSRLYVRALDSFEPRPLDGTEGASAPFFSPDGQFVAFFAAGRLRRTSVNGGAVATICDAPEDTGGGSGGAWGSDDTIVFAGPANARAGLSRVSAYGGKAEPLTSPDPGDEGGHGDPAFVPGTNTVLFTTRLTKAGVAPSINALSLPTRQQRRLIQRDAPVSGDGRAAAAAAIGPAISRPMFAAGHLVFLRGRTIVAAAFRPDTLELTGPVEPIVEDVWDFRMSLGGRIIYSTPASYGGQLVWVDRKGSSEAILEDDRRFGRPRLSPNGSQLVMEVLRGTRSDIGVYRFSTRALTMLTSDGVSNSPYWHPDGRRVVFRSPGRLLWQSADGIDRPEVLLAASDPALRSTSSLAPGVFLPDGSSFLFVVHASTGTSADIFSLALGGNRRIAPLVQRPGNQWGVRVSPDGKWISYASDESGRFEVYIEPSTRGQVKYQVSNDGGSEAVWSPAGKELFYRTGDRLMAVPISTNAESPVGAPQPLFSGQYQQTDLPHYDVTADGQRFVMVKPTEDDPSHRTIRVIDGWFNELKRRETSSR
jgi:serine/threonine-protein kinase